MSITDKIRELFNPKITKEFNEFSVSHSEALMYWISNRFQPRNIIPDKWMAKFVEYDKELGLFRHLGAYNSKIENLNFRQKQFIVERKDSILLLYDKFLYFYHIKDLFEHLYSQYPLAMRYYVEKEIGIAVVTNRPEQVIQEGCYGVCVKYSDIRPTRSCHANIASLKDLQFEIKEHICQIDKKVFIDINTSLERNIEYCLNIKVKNFIEVEFRNKISNDKRRCKYYRAFIRENGIKNDIEEYCINFTKELDEYITTTLKHQYNELKRKYPEGINYYDSINDFCEGDHLTGIDYWEDCVRQTSSIKKQHEIALEYNRLYAKYPNGIDEYKNSHQTIDDNLCCVFVPSKEEIVNLGEDKLKELEGLSKVVRRNRQWIKRQHEFAKKCRNIHNEALNGWGCYCYDLIIENPSFRTYPNKDNYRVWEHFFSSYCADSLLDYTYTPKQLKEYTEIIPKLKEMKCHYKDSVYDKIIKYLCLLRNEYGNILVVFGDSAIEGKKFNSYQFRYFKTKLEENSIFYGSDLINLKYPFLYKYIVVVEVISTNDHLKEQCMEIIDKFKSHAPHIVYISLEKEYDTNEMYSIINDIRLKKEEELREAKKQEEERQKKNQEIIERKRALEKRIEEEKSTLMRCVSNWYEPRRSYVKCFSMYNYYPTTCDWEANDNEWWVRNLIWDFKANPNKPQPISLIMELHRRASNIIIVNLAKCLRYFFGNELSKLTFVCIPSSKAVVTQRRYEDFSEQLCTMLGMSNAYQYINVEHDGEAKHIGGTMKAKYVFDDSFFKGKYILLFDDVITSGSSMEAFKNQMERMNAFVVGGISIGVTKHDRQDWNPIDRLESFNNTYYDELPF